MEERKADEEGKKICFASPSKVLLYLTCYLLIPFLGVQASQIAALKIVIF